MSLRVIRMHAGRPAGAAAVVVPTHMLIIQGGGGGGIFLDTFESISSFREIWDLGPLDWSPESRHSRPAGRNRNSLRTYIPFSFLSLFPSTPLFQLSRNS